MNNGRSRLTWEMTAIKLAFNIAEYRSEDPYCQVGAVIVKKDNTLLLGYNGAPAGLDMDWTNREERRKRVFHAESNVLNNIAPGEAKFIAITHLPCEHCLKLIKQKEINLVYYAIIMDHYDPEFVFKLAKEYDINLIRLYITK
jgi:dCMP deaminase